MSHDERDHSRVELSSLIAARLRAQAPALKSEFQTTDRIPSCWVDNLLPDEIARAVFEAFPPLDQLVYKDTLRERKYIGVEMDAYDPLIKEITLAFQDPAVVDAVSDITGLLGLEPDAQLYAGGISAMPQGAFLRPHIDNSHDGERARFRALNLLYYVTPDWNTEYGGNFELWDKGPGRAPREVQSAFNRLVIMATNRYSWHSVNTVKHDGVRLCVSNYYFSTHSPENQDYFHVTSFRGRDGEPVTDMVLRADRALRMTIRRILKNGLVKTSHVYQKQK